MGVGRRPLSFSRSIRRFSFVFFLGRDSSELFPSWVKLKLKLILLSRRLSSSSDSPPAGCHSLESSDSEIEPLSPRLRLSFFCRLNTCFSSLANFLSRSVDALAFSWFLFKKHLSSLCVLQTVSGLPCFSQYLQNLPPPGSLLGLGLPFWFLLSFGLDFPGDLS